MQNPESQPDDDAFEFLELLEPESMLSVLPDATDTGIPTDSKLSHTKEHAADPHADDEEYEFLELLEPDPIEERITSQSSDTNSKNEEYEFLELLELDSATTDESNNQSIFQTKTDQAATSSIALEQSKKSKDIPNVIPPKNSSRKLWRWAGVAIFCIVVGILFLHIKETRNREQAYTSAMTEGRNKQSGSDFSGAIAAFTQALTIPGYEDNGEAKRLLAESQGVKQRSEYFNTAMNEGYQRRTEGDYTAAIATFNKALDIPGYSDNSHAQQILHETENTAENARNFTVAINEGRRQYEAKNYKAAINSFQKALNIPEYTQNKEAAQLLREAQGRELDANHFASVVDEGKRLYDMRQYDEAVVVFRQALNMPGHADDIEVRVLLREAEVIGENAKTFTAAMNSGKNFSETKQYDEAATAFQQALNTPGYADDAEAKTLLRDAEVLGYNTKTFTSIMNKGMSLYQAKEYDDAAVAFRQALEVAGYESHEAATRLLNESNFASAFFEGTRQIEEKNYDAARVSFQRALDMPGNEQHHEAVQQWLTHAIAASEVLKRQAEAELLSIEQANRNRDNFNTAVVDGRTKYEKKDYSGAARAFETALSIPGYADHAQAKQWLTAMRTADSKRQTAIRQAQERAERERAEALARASVVAQESVPRTATPVPARVRTAAPRPLPKSIQWFAIIDGEPSEPFTPDSLRRDISTGRVTRATPLWRDGMNEWTPAGELPEIAQFFPVMPSPAPAYTAASVERRPSSANEEHDGEEPEATEREGINPEVKNVLKGLAGSVLNEVFKRVR